ncbi:MAG: hypothetical protein JO336_12205 [Acidobacteriia bacterium]|nr:hypothetical protein [Terriglobia bacterium]
MLDTIASVEGLLSKPEKEKPSGEKEKPSARWVTFTGICTFILYVFGYLTLRFHLNSFGVDTDLAVLDERYLFAGAQFLVYFATSLPVAIPIILFGHWVLWKLRIDRWPNGVILAGIVVSVVLIQFIIRKCLVFTNLLLREDGLPQPGWMQALLLDGNGARQFLYFTGLVVAIGVLASALWQAVGVGGESVRVSGAALALLIAIQFLMLPVTFGVLIADKSVARVSTLDGKDKLKSNEQAWRIWEGKEGTTFFVVEWEGKTRKAKTLVTLDKKRIEATRISGYDPVLKLLY